MQRLRLQMCLAVVTLHAVLATSAADPQQDVGIYASTENFERNLKYLTENMLPVDWKLNVVLKWNAYGHDIQSFAEVASRFNHSVSMLHNPEAAAAAAVTPKPRILRVKPANYSEAVEAVQNNYGLEELVIAENLADIVAAGRDTNTTIPVHIYLWLHYDDPLEWRGWDFTTSEQLQALVDTLDTNYVKVVGVMAHIGSYEEEELQKYMTQKFLEVTRPVAAALAPQPVAIHYAASDPFLALMPEGENITRAQPPTGPPACASPNIEFWARLGSVLYGDQPEYNEFVDDDWLPTFLWNATISAIGQTRTRAGVYRQVAVVNLQPHRFPADSWWPGIEALAPGDNTSLGRPNIFVYINGNKHYLAEPPAGDGSVILVDITGTDPEEMPEVGDVVCLTCEDQPLQDFADNLGFDYYNVALCLQGQAPTNETDFDPAHCQYKPSV